MEVARRTRRLARPTRSARIAAALAASAIGAWACGITADFSGIQGGVRDAGASSDAGLAAPDADGGKGFCASLSPAPRLCADFDEAKPIGTGWTLLDVSDSATVKVDSTGFESAASMLSAITPDDVPGFARLREAVPLQTTRLHIEFAMLLPTGGGPFELCAVHETAALTNKDYGLFYKEEQGNLLVYLDTLAADGGLTESVYSLGAPPNHWLRVTIDFTLGDSGSVRVTHDGAVVIDAKDIPTGTAGITQIFVALGFFSRDGATARANFDDVIVDWP